MIRVRKGQGLKIDDGLLLLACICITASTVLLYTTIADFYVLVSLVTDHASALSHDDSVKELEWLRKMGVAFEVLSQSAIVAIRLSFLSFFRRLIDRLGRIIYYWRVTVFVTAAISPFTASSDFISKYFQDQEFVTVS